MNSLNEISKDLALSLNGVKCKEKIGICLDTCHLNDAGYDISNFDSILDGINNLISEIRTISKTITERKNIIKKN